MALDTPPVKILIADDHPLIREGFRNLLKKQNWMAIVGEAADGREVLTLVRETIPELIILDIKMPHLNGIETCKVLSSKYPHIPVIAFSMFDEEEYIIDMLEAGAKGYILKNTGKEELIAAIRAVHAGGEYHCNIIKQRIFQLMRHGKLGVAKQQSRENFTQTEINIVKLLCKELTSKGIADYLQLTHRTVEHYKEKIQEKMGVTTSMGMLFYAWKHRLIRPEEVELMN